MKLCYLARNAKTQMTLAFAEMCKLLLPRINLIKLKWANPRSNKQANKINEWMKLWILLGNATTQMTSFIPSFFWPLLRCAANSCFARTNLIKLTIFEMGVEEMTPIRNREGPSLYYVSKKIGWVYSEKVDFYRCSVQVNLCQKLLF